MREAHPPAFELDALIRLFYPDPSQLGMFEHCPAASDLPAIYQRLLAHSAHMTVTVESRHGCTVDVEVLVDRQVGNHYERKILLRRSTDHRVVQFGIVRLALNQLEDVPRREILAKEIPLGRVLINHNVMRHVELLDLWKIACGRELAEYFETPLATITYGRTALIYCNAAPAIELLEIVAPETL